MRYNDVINKTNPIKDIQPEFTRIADGGIHKYLLWRVSSYKKWHEYPHYSTRHFIIFLAIVGIIFAFLSRAINNSNISLTDSISIIKASENARFVSRNSQSLASGNSVLVKIRASSKPLLKNNSNPRDTGIDSLNKINIQLQASGFEQIGKPNKYSKSNDPVFQWYKIVFARADSEILNLKDANDQVKRLKNAIDLLKNDKNIETVQPDYTVEASLAPNDPYYASTGSWGQSYPDLWGIKKINAAGAWDVSTGSSSIVVADIDTGIDKNHPDIAANMWVNVKEIPGNGKDDDLNGYIDDYYGWNFINNTGNPTDDNGHGSHTAGTIGAVGNNALGVVGINWNVKIMALKFLDANGSGFTSNGIKALQYAADMGARVSNNSWGGQGSNPALDDAIRYEHDKGMVTLVAAGNSNADALDFTPANSDYAVAVAATDYNDQKAGFSNFGEKIDVAAPGVNILSLNASNTSLCSSRNTVVGTYYCYLSGTSMATPHVAGLTALILSANPSLTNEEIRQIIRGGTIDLGSAGKDSLFGYGRIDAGNSVSQAASHVLSPIITSPASRTTLTSTVLEIYGSVPGPEFSSYTIEAGPSRSPGSWVTLANSTVQVATNGRLAIIDATKIPDGLDSIRLTATDTGGRSYQFQINDITVNNIKSSIDSPNLLVPKQTAVPIIGSAFPQNGLTLANYTLDWQAYGGTSWSTRGINLINSGLQPVSSGTLATWDTSALSETPPLTYGYYLLRLRVTTTSGLTEEIINRVQVDSNAVIGWPKIINVSRTYDPVSPVMYDLDGDGTKEIIQALDSSIYVFKKDGSLLSGFPVSLPVPSGAINAVIDSAPNIADVDNDGKPEIMQTIGYYDGVQNVKKIYLLKNNGVLYPGWPGFVFPDRGDLTPSIGDLDKDGRPDMVVVEAFIGGASTSKLHAYHPDGTEATGFPALTSLERDTSYICCGFGSAPSVIDMDKDGNSEIAYLINNRAYLFDNTGNILAGWPKISGQTSTHFGLKDTIFRSPAAVTDLDSDGKLELLAQAIANGVAGSDTKPLLYAWTKNGTILNGWPQSYGSTWNGWSGNSAPAGVNLSNGKDAVITGQDTLNALDAGGLLWSSALNGYYTSAVSPAAADVNGDGKLEFVSGNAEHLTIFTEGGSIYKDWDFFWNRDIGQIAFYSGAVMADMDKNSKTELAATAMKGTDKAVVMLWELPGTGTKGDWPMPYHDSARTGYLTNIPKPPASSDTTPPTVAITYPLNGSKVTGNAVTIQVSAADDVKVIKVEIYVDNNLMVSDTLAPYSYKWQLKKVTAGSHTISAKAYDAAGNVGSANISVIK